MEFKTLALAVLTVIVLLILIILAVNLSGILSEQATNATGLLRL